MLISIFININIVNAKEALGFEYYYNIWVEKSALASNYLTESEKAFENGDELTGCAALTKASNFGIEATNSLISAINTTETKDGLDNLEVGLQKWIELGEAC